MNMPLILAANLQLMKPVLLILALISAALILSSIVFTAINATKKASSSMKVLFIGIYAITAIVLACTIFCLIQYKAALNASNHTEESTTGNTETTGTTAETTEATTLPEEIPEPTFEAGYVDSSNPENWGITWDIIQGGSILDSYTRENPITFGAGSEYTALEGIITFRGDNYRSGATYGTANAVNETISQLWSSNIGALNGWPGSGWTGQPLIVRWNEETKAVMNMYDSKKATEDLVEVIYATLDGYIYTAPSLHWTANSSSQGTISIYKINAKTGEIVWEVPFDCHTVSGVSGGLQSTPLLENQARILMA